MSSISLAILFISLTTSAADTFSILPDSLFDYSPPSPPSPSPPIPPSSSCEAGIGGVGSFDTLCRLEHSVDLDAGVSLRGNGSFEILTDVVLSCSVPGCAVIVNITGDFALGDNASILVGAFTLDAANAAFGDGAVVSTTGLAGAPPEQTSGTPSSSDGSGGGHGGRGACCNKDKKKLPEDVWGGDAYAWDSLMKPVSFGSKGGSTSREEDHGGGGGGTIMLQVHEMIEMNGTVSADGADGGLLGGGGSGGSIYIQSLKMFMNSGKIVVKDVFRVFALGWEGSVRKGNGRITAVGGNGYGGGEEEEFLLMFTADTMGRQYSFMATSFGYCQIGLVVSATEVEPALIAVNDSDSRKIEQPSRNNSFGNFINNEIIATRKRIYGGVINTSSLCNLEEKKNFSYPCSLVLRNTKPVGHQVVAFVCGFVHYKTQTSAGNKHPNFQPWNLSSDESGWWVFSTGLVLCKFVQAQLINWHVANLEIQDRSLYSSDPDLFWQS
ncbi:hypothetical protein QJS10_CPA07g01024 [Acorus calamus]|uniref:Uncharacterized protein n=1 Tax=Acorus calamus TaxID=4465 RepID=A0AAV9EHY5_ACOCL|nr:hypothetical protein QJS10_CPA07g01024 [Acorus calamus]